MENYSILVHLRKIIPDINLLDDSIQNIITSDIGYESKVVKILSRYFQAKKEKYLYPSYNEILVGEAKELQNLFPSKTFHYLYDQLEVFKDLPNRKEIVIRHIVHSKCPNKFANGMTPVNEKHCVKRVAEIFDNINNNQPNAKAPKVSQVPNSFNVMQEPREKSPVSSTVTARESTEALGVAHAARVIQAPKLKMVKFSPKISVTSTITSSNTPLAAPRFNPLDYHGVLKPATITSTVTSSFQQGPHFGGVNGLTRRRAEAACVNSDITITSKAVNNLNPCGLFHKIPNIPDTTSAVINLQSACDCLDTNETRLELEHESAVAVDLSGDSPNLDKLVDSTVSNVTIGTPSDQHGRKIAPQQNLGDIMLNKRAHQISNQYSNVIQNDDSLDSNVKPARKGIVRSISETNIVNNEVPKVKFLRTAECDHKKSIVDYGVPLSAVELSSESQSSETRSQSVNETRFDNEDAQVSSESEKLGAGAAVSALSPLSCGMSKVPEEVMEVPCWNLRRKLRDPISESLTKEDFFQIVVDNELVQNVPSVAVPPHVHDMSTGRVKFNLVDYISELTTAPLDIVEKHCKKFGLSLEEKPSPDLLNTVIDTILTYNEIINDDVTEVNCPDSSDVVIESANEIMGDLGTSRISMAKNADVKSNRKSIDVRLVTNLCSIFPDACPKFVKRLCKGKTFNDEVLNDLITFMLNANNTYPKRPQPPPEPETVPENQLEILQEFLPDADPDYLRMTCDNFEGKPELVKAFLNEAMEKRDYPTMKDYQRRQQLSAQQKQYTTEFTVENFIKVIPEPHAFFSDPSRNVKLDVSSAHYALIFLRNKFNKLPIRVIQTTFTKNNSKLSETIKALTQAYKQSQHIMKSVRKPIEMPKNIENIPLLQEIAYYTHQEEINDYLNDMKNKKEAERREAKQEGLMKTCNCCYDEEVLPKEICCCENGCEFCEPCLVKYVEVRFGEGKLDFPCMMTCESSFSLQTLQTVLSPKLFSKIAQKKALEEVKSAGIEELEFCPFCDFATIPAEGYNIFACMNPDCMKESCRMCKEPSHIPLRCDEVEKDEDVRARTFVENKMTEALLRKCWKCGVKFFKEEGCNKMTCSCGAQMCYVCGQPVTGYQHFNGNGGDRYDLCPLYSDSNILNKQNVLKGAEQAKAEIGNVNLKHDPTADVDKHYTERSKRNPQAHLLVGQQQPIMAVPPQVGVQFGGALRQRYAIGWQRQDAVRIQPHRRH